MKKIVLLGILLANGLTAHAQFKAGASLAALSGNNQQDYTLSYGIDTYSLFGKPEAVFRFGIGLSYLTYLGDEVMRSGQTVKVDNLSFIPIALAPRFVFDGLYIGPDIGFAAGLGNDSAFYFKFVLGIDLTSWLELDLFYNNTTKIGVELNTLGGGLLYKF